MHDTARRHADLVLPSTSWLETTGCKSTNTHLYLMPKVLDPPGETRPPAWVLRELARRLELRDFFPWTEETGRLDALLDHPATGHATAARCRRERWSRIASRPAPSGSTTDGRRSTRSRPVRRYCRMRRSICSRSPAVRPNSRPASTSCECAARAHLMICTI